MSLPKMRVTFYHEKEMKGDGVECKWTWMGEVFCLWVKDKPGDLKGNLKKAAAQRMGCV